MTTLEQDLLDGQRQLLIELVALMERLSTQIDALELAPTYAPDIRLPAPVVNVPAPVVEVQGAEVDLSQLAAMVAQQNEHLAGVVDYWRDVLSARPPSGPAVNVKGITDRLDTLLGRTDDATGTWAYQAATSGTISVASGARVVGIAATAASAGASFTIDGGDAIPVPQNTGIDINPKGNIVGPVDIVFTGTSSCFVETLS